MELDKRALRLYFQKDEGLVHYVYEHYYRLLYHVAFGLLKVKEEAEDAVQETFLKSFEKKATDFKGPREFVSFLCAVCRNLSFNRLMVRKRETELGESEPGDGEETYESGLFERLKPSLLEKEYDTLLLRAGAGYSFRDIAFFLQMKEGAARALYHRALVKAKKILKGEKDETR